MQKSIAACVSNLGALRTGRASPDVLKRVVVDYYGAETPLNQLASISVASGTQLVVSPFDKSTLGDVEAALLDANLGMTSPRRRRPSAKKPKSRCAARGRRPTTPSRRR